MLLVSILDSGIIPCEWSSVEEWAGDSCVSHLASVYDFILEKDGSLDDCIKIDLIVGDCWPALHPNPELSFASRAGLAAGFEILVLPFAYFSTATSEGTVKSQGLCFQVSTQLPSEIFRSYCGMALLRLLLLQ